MENPNEHEEVRDLFAAIVSKQPGYSETTSTVAHKGRRIRRRRRIAAVGGGLGLAAMVAFSVTALQDDFVRTEPAPVAERPETTTPSAPVTAPTISTPVSTPVSTPASGQPAPDDAKPDPARPVYCGSITAVDVPGGRVTLRADTSYRVAGDIYDDRPDDATYTVPVAEDFTVLEFTLPKGTDVRTTGSRDERLAAVQRLADGPKRPYVGFTETGEVERISFGVNNGEPETPDCLRNL